MAAALICATRLASRMSRDFGAAVGTVVAAAMCWTGGTCGAGGVRTAAAARGLLCGAGIGIGTDLAIGLGTELVTDWAPAGAPSAIRTERAPPIRATRYLLCILIL